MKDVSEVTLCVADHGLFLPIALRLAEACKKVYYWSPDERVMRRLDEGVVGDGFSKITRAESIWSVKSECDGFIFPDIGFTGEQKELQIQGYPVWGHNGGDELEVNRGLFLRTVKELGLDVPPHTIIQGMTKLREYLKNHDDKYIKISKWRGDWETFHWRNWEQDEATLDLKSWKLGPTKELITFYVFDPIDTDIEDGLDLYSIDGHHPSLVMHGMECKDKSYLCSIQKYEEVPEPVKKISDAFFPVLGRYGYRGFFSFETRIKDEKSYPIDPTCRAGSPPSQCMMKMLKNLPEIMWKGANGICIDPEPEDNFAGQILMSCDRDDDEWLTLDIPKSIRESVTFGFACEINGMTVVPPHPLKNMIGWLCGTGATIKDLISDLKDKAGELPEGIDCDINTLANLLSEVQSAEEKGMEFTDQPVPDPAIVIDS